MGIYRAYIGAYTHIYRPFQSLPKFLLPLLPEHAAEEAGVREKTVEQKLVQAVRAKGGVCWKFTSPSTVGVPDRVVILPGGHIGFVEVKAPGEKPRPVQAIRIEQLRGLGATCLVLDDISEVEAVCDAIQRS
nr:MAG TPA: Nuclease [Caudoviricetes sp.]